MSGAVTVTSASSRYDGLGALSVRKGRRYRHGSVGVDANRGSHRQMANDLLRAAPAVDETSLLNDARVVAPGLPHGEAVT